MVLELASKKKQRKYKDEPHDARAKKMDTERRKYSLLLTSVIKNAELPVVKLVESLDDPASAWVHLFAARRANTLKNRYKSWKPFQNWLKLHRGRLFPTSCKDAIDYIQFRVDEGCGKTVPESFSVSWACWRCWAVYLKISRSPRTHCGLATSSLGVQSWPQRTHLDVQLKCTRLQCCFQWNSQLETRHSHCLHVHLHE